MTFDEIVSSVCGRLNLSSPEAITRVGEEVNERYKEVTTSLGLITSTRTVTSVNTSIGSPYVTFTGITKVLSVFDNTVTPARVLGEVTVDEIRNGPTLSGSTPQLYAVALMGSQSVTILLDGAAATVFPLSADAYANAGTLSGAMLPAFAENYHNILIYGAMSTELDKMEKPNLALKQESKFERRLGELRLFIAISAYKDIYQGKSPQDRRLRS